MGFNIQEMLKVILMGIVQGITEWLPISSTGHMLLLDEFIKMDYSENFKNMFFVLIQFGSILAVVLLYFNKLNPFGGHKRYKEKKETYAMWGKIIIGSMPAAIVGFLLADPIRKFCYKPIPIALALIVYGILFIWVENRNKRPFITEIKHLGVKEALFIGLFQMLALIPGTSRSGATILSGLIVGTSRYVAAEWSFFLAVPIMFGASGYEVLKSVLKGGVDFSGNELMMLIVAMVVSFIVSIFAIKFLMSYIKNNGFKGFGIYRIALGILVLLYFVGKDLHHTFLMNA